MEAALRTVGILLAISYFFHTAWYVVTVVDELPFYGSRDTRIKLGFLFFHPLYWIILVLRSMWPVVKIALGR